MLLSRLGSGGMGRVYLARSPGGRTVAVKVIRANLAEDAGFRARFAREVSAAAKVGGLFTAAVVDADVDGPVPWLVTAYVPGTSLSDAVERQGPLPEASVLALAAGLAEGLIAIHAAGVIHRDLKPSNVLLAQDGPRIIDFGISSAAEATALTGTGFMIGSPGFMSPEQAEGLTVGPASDIFSLAGVLIYAARGEGPFGSGDTAALLYRVVHGKPSIDNVPDNLRPLIKRSLSRDPKRRPTATQFLTDLSAAYPSAADLSNWLPARILYPSAAGTAPAEPSLHPPAPGGSMAGGSAGRRFWGRRFWGRQFYGRPVRPRDGRPGGAGRRRDRADGRGGRRDGAADRRQRDDRTADPDHAVPADAAAAHRDAPRRPGVRRAAGLPRSARLSRAAGLLRPARLSGPRVTQASKVIPGSRATQASRATLGSSTPSRRATRRTRGIRSLRAVPGSRRRRAVRGGPASSQGACRRARCPARAADRECQGPTSGMRLPPGRAGRVTGRGGWFRSERPRPSW